MCNEWWVGVVCIALRGIALHCIAGRLSAAEFLARFTSLSDAFGGKRAAVEDYFDALLKAKERKEQLRAAPPHTLLGLLGAVGYYGLSVRDKADPTAAVAPEPQAWTIYERDKPAPKRRPDVRAWCWYALEALPVERVCAWELRAELGETGYNAVVGVREASERVAADGYFHFLRVLPLLKAHGALPDIDLPHAEDKKAHKRRCEEYLKTAAELRAVAASTYDLGLSELAIVSAEREAKRKAEEAKKKAATEMNAKSAAADSKAPAATATAAAAAPAASTAAAAGDSKSLAAVSKIAVHRSGEPHSLVLAKSWLQCLVRYAPSIEALSAQFDDAGFAVLTPKPLLPLPLSSNDVLC